MQIALRTALAAAMLFAVAACTDGGTESSAPPGHLSRYARQIGDARVKPTVGETGAA